MPVNFCGLAFGFHEMEGLKINEQHAEPGRGPANCTYRTEST